MWACERGPFPRDAAQARAVDPLMTVCDVAALVRVDVRTVERWLDEGLLYCVNLVGRDRQTV